MESLFGMENMARGAATARMIKSYEKEIREAARVVDMIKQSEPFRAAWYCPLLERVGVVMISLGTRLKKNYSTDHALRSR
ncbi:MAG: hypothetical protein HY863_02415 [Chloroflexi bacterium]|nr:hypothetical protein [Chloroflexota bacterium]